MPSSKALRYFEMALLFALGAAASITVIETIIPRSCVSITSNWVKNIDRSRHRDFVLRHRGILQRGKCRTFIIRDCPDSATARHRAAAIFNSGDWMDEKKVTCTPYEVDPQKNFFEYVP